jgi:hypothetical protein
MLADVKQEGLLLSRIECRVCVQNALDRQHASKQDVVGPWSDLEKTTVLYGV